MRNKIDYGIDLGTTNSAIARMENGEPVIKKSDTLKDTTPSTVNINKKQDIVVGDTAFNILKNDNARALKTFVKGKTNTFLEFKRTMGTTHSYPSSNLNKELTSEELSAEVLKKLKSFILDENVNSIVITVPAKFLNPQKDATLKAAKLAGFKHVELLQEPVAAATAYGLSSKNKSGYWVVFDFGGGTFDAAIIKADEGILSVKDTAGDNWLGGKNLDEAIVDNIIIPHIQENFEIDFVINDNEKHQMLRDAVKSFAEEAKVQLSFKESHSLLTNLGDLPFEDENGEEPEIDIDISIQDLEKIFSPIFQQAIDITKDLIKRNNLSGKDIDALILVGGPTYSPILRKMIKEQITDKIDMSTDPMTAVAKGAALFASTLSVSEEVKETTRDKTKLQLEVNYEATSVDLEELINISLLKNKTKGTIPDQVFLEIRRSDGAWASGKKEVTEKKSIMELILREGESNLFEIFAFDKSGNRIECQPKQFTILQGIGGLDAMSVLPYHIGIVKYFDDEEKDLFEPVSGLEKNKKVPAVGVRNGLKTRTKLLPGVVSDIIRIPIYQGDFKAEGTNPILNNKIYEVIISGENLPGLLPAGSDVDITIKVDRSENIEFSAYFPLLDHTEELQIEIKQTEPPQLDFLKNQLAAAKNSAQKNGATEISTAVSNLEHQLVSDAGSADGKLKILENLRKQLLKLDSVEKGAEWPTVENNLKDSFYELEDLVDKIKSNGHSSELNMEVVNAHIQEYRVSVAEVMEEKNLKAAKKLLKEIDQLDFELRNAASGNAMDVQYLQYVEANFHNYNWKNSTKAKQLLNHGLQLVSEGKNSDVRAVLLELVQLMPLDQKPTGTLA